MINLISAVTFCVQCLQSTADLILRHVTFLTIGQRDEETMTMTNNNKRTKTKLRSNVCQAIKKKIPTIKVVQLSHIDPNCSTGQTEGTSITVAQANCLRFLA